MKKYLNNSLRTNIFLLTLFLGLVFISQQAFSQSKLEYYQKVFREEFEINIYEDGVGETEESLLDAQNLEGVSENYYILLTSLLQKMGDGLVEASERIYSSDLDLGARKRIILICDAPYESVFPVGFSCDGKAARSTLPDESFMAGEILKNENTQDIDLYVIPESLLMSPDKRSEAGKYLKAIIRADGIPLMPEDAEVEEEGPSLLGTFLNLKNSMMFQAFKISFSMFSLAILSYELLKFLSRDDKKITISDLKDFLNINKRIPMYQRVVFYIVIWLIFFYFVLVTLISISKGHGVDLGFILSYSIDRLNIRNISGSISSGNYFKIGVFFYETVVLSLLFILFIPYLKKIFGIVFTKITYSKIKIEVGKYSLPILVFFLLAGSLFFEIKESSKFLILVSLLLFFIFFKCEKCRLKEYSYSKKERAWFIFIALIIISSGLLIRFKESKAGPIYKSEDLIGVRDDIVLLPYSKQLGERVFIKEYNTSSSEPIFVDNYLVYSPNHSRIENKNAKEFKNEGTFYIQSGNVEDMVSAIYSNDTLAEELISQSPSNFFKISNLVQDQNLREEDTEPVDIEITFSCKRQNLGFHDLIVDFYYVEGEEIKHKDETLMYFPGCEETSKPKNVKVEFNPPYSESGEVFLRLRDLLASDIQDIKIFKGSDIKKPTYFLKTRGYGIIDSGGLTTSSIVPVTNYIFDSSYDLSFDMELNEEGKFDLSKPINELIKEGVLEDSFLIWSNKKYLPVRLDD